MALLLRGEQAPAARPGRWSWTRSPLRPLAPVRLVGEHGSGRAWCCAASSVAPAARRTSLLPWLTCRYARRCRSASPSAMIRSLKRGACQRGARGGGRALGGAHDTEMQQQSRTELLAGFIELWSQTLTRCKASARMAAMCCTLRLCTLSRSGRRNSAAASQLPGHVAPRRETRGPQSHRPGTAGLGGPSGSGCPAPGA